MNISPQTQPEAYFIINIIIIQALSQLRCGQLHEFYFSNHKHNYYLQNCKDTTHSESLKI